MTGIVVRPVRFTSHLPEMQQFFERARPAAVDRNGQRRMARSGLRRRPVALPIVRGERAAAVQLTFQSLEPLEQIADRLSGAGFEPGILVEDLGSLLHVTEPDGQEVQVHTEA